jgi:hypothetical protein
MDMDMVVRIKPDSHFRSAISFARLFLTGAGGFLVPTQRVRR